MLRISQRVQVCAHVDRWMNALVDERRRILACMCQRIMIDAYDCMCASMLQCISACMGHGAYASMHQCFSMHMLACIIRRPPCPHPNSQNGVSVERRQRERGSGTTPIHTLHICVLSCDFQYIYAGGLFSFKPHRMDCGCVCVNAVVCCANRLVRFPRTKGE